MVAFGLLLAACAADSQPGSNDSGTTGVTKAPAADQVLRLRIQSEPKTIDPQLIQPGRGSLADSRAV